MRIVSGELRGRRFAPPASFKARPTTDQARESLFNILNNLMDIEEQTALDLFGGTGAISYELASRGCKSITCVEKNFSHFRFISKTASNLGLTSRIKPIKANVFEYLSRDTGLYSLIFADPPFDLPRTRELPSLVMGSGLLKEDGLFILEHGSGISFEDNPSFWQIRKYGKVNFSFFKP